MHLRATVPLESTSVEGSAPCGSGGGGEPRGPGCTEVLRLRYLTVPLESTSVEGISHALNMVLAENVPPKDTLDTNIHTTR